MIVARLPLGSRFQQRVDYLFRHGHDTFAITQNLVSPARESTTEMDNTWESQPRLKEAAGIRRGGRRCTHPVTHDVLSWDEDERPDIAEMMGSAKSFLAAIGLADHQAVIVGHDHNGKRHVHIVANAIHPITGRVADRTNDQKKAQAWALAYEQAQGRVRCKHRTAPRMIQAFTLSTTEKTKSGQRLSRTAHARKQVQRQADIEARLRHKAENWVLLTAQQQSAMANADVRPDQQMRLIRLRQLQP